jgi:type II secretory pathway pseudopilin PulG
VEVIAVLVLLGIVAAVVASGSMSQTGQALRVLDLDKVKAHLRYAQARAMSDAGGRYYLAFTGSTYSLYRLDLGRAGSAVLTFPGEEGTVVSLSEGVSAATDRNVGFDEIGRPLTGNPGAMQSLGSLNTPLVLGFTGTGGRIQLNYNGYVFSEN